MQELLTEWNIGVLIGGVVLYFVLNMLIPDSQESKNKKTRKKNLKRLKKDKGLFRELADKF